MFNKGNNNLITHFAKTSQAQQTATFPWITSDWTSFATSEAYGAQNAGSTWFDAFGNVFTLKVMRSTAAAIGNALMWPASGADTATAASTTRVATLTTGGLTAGAEVNNWFYEAVIARTGTPKTDGLKLIKGNTANTITVSNLDTKYGNAVADPDAYATAPANTDPVAIIRPYEVALGAITLAITPPAGIAVQAITQNAWGFMQVGGLGLVTHDGAAAVTDRQCLILGATAGLVKSGGATHLVYCVGTAAAPVATVAASCLVPVWISNALMY